MELSSRVSPRAATIPQTSTTPKGPRLLLRHFKIDDGVASRRDLYVDRSQGADLHSVETKYAIRLQTEEAVLAL